MAALSYLGAHWTLIIVVVLAVAVLGYLAFILKNWKAALAAVVLVMAGLAYQSADLAGYKRRVNEEAQAQVKLLNSRLAVLEAVSKAYNARAAYDAATIKKLEDEAKETPANSDQCLPADAARRVRSIR
jgi:cell division protein FtsB